jgi:hypothetical protein
VIVRGSSRWREKTCTTLNSLDTVSLFYEHARTSTFMLWKVGQRLADTQSVPLVKLRTRSVVSVRPVP